ncbi:MAG TPA: DEAD/DEAH box helicase [Candidatus Polarisedimenticolaceae bacterium]|nr:DEAD/DEAH box helicase [Candidatus Polarisedimenticolaceae bacterium]
MARSATKLRPRRPAGLPAHPLLLATDLRTWAGDESAASGRREALLGRVSFLRLAPSGRLIEAKVRGNRTAPYHVQVWVEDERIHTRCTCAGGARSGCKHAVAALETMRFPLSAAAPASVARRSRVTARKHDRGFDAGAAQSGYLLFGGAERSLTREERIEAARQLELTLRRGKARKEREPVVALAPDGGPPRFEVGARDKHRVTLRGDNLALAACTCDDYAHGELHSCAHIERVRMWYLRKKKQIPTRLLSVWWRPRVWTDRQPETLREIRADAADQPLPDELAPFFDRSGWLAPAPPDRDGAAWLRDAVEASCEAARGRGWVWDLDAGVASWIDQQDRERHHESLLDTISRATPAWHAIVARLGFRLHPYQETGALFLARRGRALLADDMGLGKTVQAIVAALLLRMVAGARRALVVCPASLKHQWRREIEKAWGERAIVVESGRAARLATYRAWTDGFLILNYELVLRDLDDVRAVRPDLVILDEAQRIKNWDTKTAIAIKRLDSRHAFILTGTPLENRLIELHSLAEHLHPRALGPRWRLLPYHAVTDLQGRAIAYEGLEVLRKRMSGFFLRRERRKVLDQLPERTDNTFWTGMTPSQQRPYRRHAATVASLVARHHNLRPGDIRLLLQSLTSMRILCNAYAQYDFALFEQRLRDPAPPTRHELRALGSPKLEEFVRVLEDLIDDAGGKIVVFSQWERMLRLAHYVVREPLAQRELRADVFHGGLNARARDEMLEAFRVDPEFHVLFSTDAGGLGLNLQESASIVINLEVPWNPAVLEQRIGRVHRLGQLRSVQVLYLVTRGAVEERVRQVVEGKRALFDGLLTEQADRVVFDEPLRASLVRRVRDLIESGEGAGAI